MDINQLIRDWHTAATERRKAEIEEELWLGCPDAKGKIRRYYLTDLLGGEASRKDSRASLFHSDQQVNGILWDLIDNQKVPIYRVLKHYRRAKERGKRDGTDLFTAFQEEMARYEVVGATVKPPKSKQVRSKPTKAAHQTKRASGSNLSKILESLKGDLENRLSGVDPLVIDRLLHEFELELKCIYDSFQHRIEYLRKREFSGEGVTVRSVSRNDVIHACRTLHLDPPPPGRPVDLERAKKLKHKLARLYHPDRNSGSEADRPRYEAVIQAYTVLEKYSQATGSN